MAGTGSTSVRTYTFFLDSTIQAAGAYVDNEHTFVDALDSTPFTSYVIQLVNDSAADIYFSFDGTTDHGRVRPGEVLTQDHRRLRQIWFRGNAGSAYRFWAY